MDKLHPYYVRALKRAERGNFMPTRTPFMDAVERAASETQQKPIPPTLTT